MGNISDQIKHGMALAFFASAFADQADECGQPLCGEIMNQLPEDIDPAAIHAADTLASQFVSQFTYKIADVPAHIKLIFLYHYAQRLPTDGADRELTPELFGHYLAMSAIGSGVGLESFGYAVDEKFPVPYVEFGSHSLQLDYFTDENEELETVEYSVCQDCLLAVAHDENGHDIGAAIGRELNGRPGHFSPGVAPTDDDPDGNGYDEFSWQECELCCSHLGGSRHGVTMFITGKAH